ncbi:hypothetical protein AVEN_104982-1 [Araneus ventricosus]|uniref:Histone-lysine N-methyltransferase SETMAR n=1 Tax=Araneus ventricosus TaxID=182803 RepID=A0A4Y2L3A8_ARAVE|nr:hypothetical protein AVEN_104982-1 [Araneus ventricosus]
MHNKHVNHRVTENPSSSPVTSSDFYLFGQLEKYLEGQHFGTNAEAQQAVSIWLRDFDADFNMLVHDRTNASTTMMTMHKSNMYHSLTTLCTSLNLRINVFLLDGLLPYFLNSSRTFNI